MKALRSVLLLSALPAMLAGLAPTVFAYDRTAILHGEWWRLWTGHWVHFSVSHLAWNLIVLLGAGAWLERLQPGRLRRYALLAAPVISLAFLLGEPAMQTYGGLSGLATGAVVLLTLVRLGQDQAARAWWIGVLALVGLKIVFDASHAVPLFSSFASQNVRTSGLAHAAGAVAAVAFALPSLVRPHSAPLRAALPAPQSSCHE